MVHASGWIASNKDRHVRQILLLCGYVASRRVTLVSTRLCTLVILASMHHHGVQEVSQRKQTGWARSILQ